MAGRSPQKLPNGPYRGSLESRAQGLSNGILIIQFRCCTGEKTASKVAFPACANKINSKQWAPGLLTQNPACENNSKKIACRLDFFDLWYAYVNIQHYLNVLGLLCIGMAPTSSMLCIGMGWQLNMALFMGWEELN
jgi:hypothetical protein